MLPIIIALGGLAIAYTFTGENLVSSEEAKKMIKSGKIKRVIDVRTYVEYKMGHYPRALHLPVNKMNKKTVSEKTSKERFARLLQLRAKGQSCGREIG